MEIKKKNKEGATASRAAAKEISMDAAVTAVLPEADGIFALGDKQRTAPTAFPCQNDISTLLQTCFDREFSQTQEYIAAHHREVEGVQYYPSHQ